MDNEKETINVTFNMENKGWICPKCNRSINPNQPSCPFCNEYYDPPPYIPHYNYWYYC